MESDPPAVPPPAAAVKRIVLTGGPGAGKTTISAEMARRRPGRFARVPEAATQVYDSLRTRWDRLDPAGRRGVQVQIYRLQVEQERRFEAGHPGHVLLLDRGTVDGAAYWPDGADDYWRTLNTTAEAELARYDAVVWLQTSAAIVTEDAGYDGDVSNARRHERPEDAIDSGRRVRALWAAHPRFYLVAATPRFGQKFQEVERLLLELADGG